MINDQALKRIEKIEERMEDVVTTLNQSMTNLNATINGLSINVAAQTTQMAANKELVDLSLKFISQEILALTARANAHADDIKTLRTTIDAAKGAATFMDKAWPVAVSIGGFSITIYSALAVGGLLP